jgi:hypothetical protein
MGTTHLQHTQIGDSSRHSAMQITLLIDIAAELRAIRLLLADLTSLVPGPGEKYSAENNAKHSEGVFQNHAKDLAHDLSADYK